MLLLSCTFSYWIGNAPILHAIMIIKHFTRFEWRANYMHLMGESGREKLNETANPIYINMRLDGPLLHHHRHDHRHHQHSSAFNFERLLKNVQCTRITLCLLLFYARTASSSTSSSSWLLICNFHLVSFVIRTFGRLMCLMKKAHDHACVPHYFQFTGIHAQKCPN